MVADTIVALSTPPGESGIAVVRLSGPEAIDIVAGMAPGARRSASHRQRRRTLRDGNGEPIDEVLLTVMRAPSSYTGEDMAEVSCHGSMQVVADLIEEFMRRGARLASAGEFTKRAFLNEKLDLAQAEAVADLISCETKLQRKVAFEQLEGRLSRKVREIEEMLLEQVSLIEVSIDFSEEDVPIFSREKMTRAAREMRGKIGKLLDSEIAGRKLRRGVRVTIVGPRNVGKSSLYNALLGEERAIVSPIPGTTRDILRERIHVGGFTCYLEDTAGLAETGCEIEAKGIKMGREAAGSADMVLFVVDGSEEIPAGTRDELERRDKARLLCVLNKKDLGLKLPAEAARAALGIDDVIAVSALGGEGLEELKAWIFAKTVRGDAAEIGRERMAVNARQGAALREADSSLARLEGLIDEDAPEEILSVEARAAAEALGKVTGRTITEEILGTIFSRFCVGK